MRYLLSLLREIGADLPGAPRAPRQRRREQAGVRGDPGAHDALGARRRPAAWASSTSSGWPTRRDVAECLRELEGKYPVGREAQVLAAPAALVVLPAARPGGAAHGGAGGSGAASFLAGARENAALVDAHHRGRLRLHRAQHLRARLQRLPRLQQALPDLAADLFFEMYSRSCSRETERRLRENDRGLHGARGPPLPGLPKEQLQTQAGIVKVMMNAPGPDLPARRRLDHRGQAAGLDEAARGGGAPAARRDHRRLPGRRDGREALRADLARCATRSRS